MYRIIDAITLASKRHEGQVRRNGTPYIYHPLTVAKMVAQAGYDEKYVITAVLHDILEDTDTTEDEIEELFGRDILAALLLVTRPEGMPEDEYVKGILKNDIASVVKNADKIHNLRDLPNTGKKERRAATGNLPSGILPNRGSIIRESFQRNWIWHSMKRIGSSAIPED